MNYSEIRIQGCALLLQVWALEHTSMVETASSSSCSWPRIRKWTSKNNIIQFTVRDKEAVPILAPTEELKEFVIRESPLMIDCYSPSTQPPSVHGHEMASTVYKNKYEELVNEHGHLRREYDHLQIKYDELCEEVQQHRRITTSVDAHNLVISTFEHCGDVVSFDDEASLMGGSLHFTDVLSPSRSPGIESSNGSKFLPSHKIGGFDYTHPTTSSPDIISSLYSIGGVSALVDSVDNMGLRYDQPLTFPFRNTEFTTPASCDDDNQQYFDTNRFLRSWSPSLESVADLHTADNSFLLARSTAVAQRRWARRWAKINSVLKWFTIRRIVVKEIHGHKIRRYS